MSASTRKRFLLATGALVLLAAGGGVAWYLTRPVLPPPPTIPQEGVETEVAEAIEEARQRVIAEPRNATAWGDLGLVLRAHNFEPQAHECFRRAGDLDGEDSRWPYLLGSDALLRDPPAALPYLRRAVELGHRSAGYRAAARLRLAEALLERNELDEAERLFQKELIAEPDSPRSRFGLGVLALARDRLEDSAGHLAVAAKSPFYRQKAAAQLALVHRRLGRPGDAERYEKEANQPPADLFWPDPYIGEWSKRQRGRMRQFERVTQLEGQGKLKEAARVLEDMAAAYPDVRTYSALGICLAKGQEFERAGEVLRATLRLEPDHVQAHYFLALCLFFEGEKRLGEGNREQAAAKFREAAEHAAAAVKLKPDHAMANLFLGRARWRLGRREQGLAGMRQAVVLSPHTSDVHLHLGEALAEDGKTEEALVELRQAVRLAPPGDPRPRQALERVSAGKEK